MNKITNEQLDSLIKSAVNSSGPLHSDEKFSQIISALRELRELRGALLQGSQPVSNRDELLPSIKPAPELDSVAKNAKSLPSNSPVIPDGWIPVSERMPGSQEWVIVFAKWANQQVLCWDDVANRWTDFEDQSYYADMFTHWMPLPAAPHFRGIGNSSTNNCRENAETSTKCWCHTCRPVTISDMRFVVCPECGNKRCPHANDHRCACTGSNEPGQEGSAYPAAPQQEAE